MKTTLALVIGMMIGVSTSTQASIVGGYGVQASAGTAGNCPSYCSGGSQGETNGAEFSTSATASDNSYGSASASAVYTSTSTYLPTLKVNASSGLRKGASANAFGVQGYTYSGTEDSITLDFNLHGSVGDNASGYVSNSVYASVAVITGSSLEWYPDYGTLVYEIASGPGVDVVGNKSVFINDGLDQNSAGFITFDVFEGMDFYVVASMNARAKNGFADAFNTFTMEFENDSGLTATAQVSAVPVPAAVWLFGSGLVGLVSLGRKKDI